MTLYTQLIIQRKILDVSILHSHHTCLSYAQFSNVEKDDTTGFIIIQSTVITVSTLVVLCVVTVPTCDTQRPFHRAAEGFLLMTLRASGKPSLAGYLSQPKREPITKVSYTLHDSKLEFR